MDNSDDAFRAAERTVELAKSQNLKETNVQKKNQENNVRDTIQPKIIAFHSSEHRKISEKMALYIPSSFGASYSIPPVDYRKLQEEYKLHGKKILKKIETLFDKNNIDIETRLVTDQKPEDYIEKAVEKENIDLVVLGSKGDHSKLEQIFSSTIAEKVLNDVPCDVLIVR
jgi:nucleotide-binding universal stress UspA family protein